jgi:hypothetical protein
MERHPYELSMRHMSNDFKSARNAGDQVHNPKAGDESMQMVRALDRCARSIRRVSERTMDEGLARRAAAIVLLAERHGLRADEMMTLLASPERTGRRIVDGVDRLAGRQGPGRQVPGRECPGRDASA